MLAECWDTQSVEGFPRELVGHLDAATSHWGYSSDFLW